MESLPPNSAGVTRRTLTKRLSGVYALLRNRERSALCCDYCSDIDGSLVAGTREQLHDGRVYSHPVGDRRNRGASPDYSGTPYFVALKSTGRK
jgi:hypothetical protein